MKPKALVMSGYGINCEKETAEAIVIAGGDAEIVHINDLIIKKKNIRDFQILVFPGGFSYGDDTGAGNAFARKVKNNLWNELMEFINNDKLVIGICNGFQILTELGLFALPSTEYGQVTTALLANTSNTYECRWVKLKQENSKCVFTREIPTTYLPVAHGEGRFYCSQDTLKLLRSNNQIVFRYCNEDGSDAEEKYPANPNGSLHDVAGICDKRGRVLGMMPHPERAIYSVSRPDYQLQKELARRKNLDVPKYVESNLSIFRNAIDYFKEL